MLFCDTARKIKINDPSVNEVKIQKDIIYSLVPKYALPLLKSLLCPRGRALSKSLLCPGGGLSRDFTVFTKIHRTAYLTKLT